MMLENIKVGYFCALILRTSSSSLCMSHLLSHVRPSSRRPSFVPTELTCLSIVQLSCKLPHVLPIFTCLLTPCLSLKRPNVHLVSTCPSTVQRSVLPPAYTRCSSDHWSLQSHLSLHSPLVSRVFTCPSSITGPSSVRLSLLRRLSLQRIGRAQKRTRPGHHVSTSPW